MHAGDDFNSKNVRRVETARITNVKLFVNTRPIFKEDLNEEECKFLVILYKKKQKRSFEDTWYDLANDKFVTYRFCKN